MTRRRPASTLPASPVQREDGQPRLIVDTRPDGAGGVAVSVRGLGLDHIRSIAAHVQAGGRLEPVLHVTVTQPEESAGDIPPILGWHEILADGLRFLPSFPFEPGIQYRAVFDLAPISRPTRAATVTLDFSVPRNADVSVTDELQVYPSGDALPENLLRFYIAFPDAMQRGRAGSEVRLLGPDGLTVADTLYRAPVELWDPAMRVLTVLLDPGRLKRGVGPNRELGPPLEIGQAYALQVGVGMTDRFGRALDAPILKRFIVTDAVRKHVAIEDWVLHLPSAGSREPLAVMFPRPLDWAMLFEAALVVAVCGTIIRGRVKVDQCETRWCFTPDKPWATGSYALHVRSVLEDPCGNNLSAAFDRPLRAEPTPIAEPELHSVAFVVSVAV